jgi:hypothetical protein
MQVLRKGEVMNYAKFCEEREYLRASFRFHLERQTLDLSSRGASVYAAYRLLPEVLKESKYHSARSAWYCAYYFARCDARKARERNEQFLQAWLPGFIKVLTA